MRLALLLVASLFAAACGSDAPAGVSASPEADRLLAAVDPASFAEAFEALADRDAVVRLGVAELDGSGQPIGLSRLRLQLTPRGARVLRQSGRGSLAEPAAEVPRFLNPIDTALPDAAPYADPATRDQYRRAVVGDTMVAGRRLRVIEAVLADPDAEQGVRRVRAAVDPETEQPVVIEVDRAAQSAVYDEQSHVRVELAPNGQTWLPHRVETDTRTDVPLAAPRRIRTVWTMLSVGAGPLTAEAAERTAGRQS